MDRIEPLELDPPKDGLRVETGPIQFGDDWPGYYFRGDSAFGLIMTILRATEGSEVSDFDKDALRSYAEEVAHCIDNRALRASISRAADTPTNESASQEDVQSR